jgi:murein L,D-transpeptidase YcbB/YkuD
VHTTYFTVVVDKEGHAKTFDDVYKLDDLDRSADAAVASPSVTSSAPVPRRKPSANGLAAGAP